MMLVGVFNGFVRVKTYGRWMPELAAHQVSCFTAVAMLWMVAVYIIRRIPLPSIWAALAVGSFWVGLTVAFEFLFGHFVAGHSWDRLTADYDLSAGRLWIIVLIGVFLAPLVGRWWSDHEGPKRSMARYE